MSSLYAFEEGDVAFVGGRVPAAVDPRVCLQREWAGPVALAIVRHRYLTQQQIGRSVMRKVQSEKVRKRRIEDLVQIGVLLPVRWGTPPTPRRISLLAAAYTIGPSAAGVVKASGVSAPRFQLAKLLEEMPVVASSLLANDLWSRLAALPFAMISGYARRPSVESRSGKATPAALMWFTRDSGPEKGRYPLIIDVLGLWESPREAAARQVVYGEKYPDAPQGADDIPLTIWIVPKDEDGRKLHSAIVQAKAQGEYAFTTGERLRLHRPGEDGWLFAYEYSPKTGTWAAASAISPRFLPDRPKERGGEPQKRVGG